MTLPLMLLHGWGFSSPVWRPLMGELHALGVEAVFPVDLPGFGSAYHEPVGSLPAILDYLTDHLPAQCVLCGWSLGGMLALALAARDPARVVGLVTLGSNPRFTASTDWPGMPEADFTGFAERFQRHPEKTWQRFLQLQTHGDQEAARAEAALQAVADFGAIETTSAEKMLDVLGAIDNRPHLASLTVPGIHVFGDRDAITPVAVAARVSALQPQHRTRVLPGASHAFPVTRAAPLAALLANFLQARVPA